MLGNQQNSKDKFGIGYCNSEEDEAPKISKLINKTKERKKCSLCKKNGHNITQCWYNKKRKPKANQSGPKKIWVPKNLIIPLADVLNRTKQTPKLVLGQWMLAAHDRKKVLVPRPKT